MTGERRVTGQRSKKYDLILDLVYLRKGQGLTTDRMFAASTLQEVCGGGGQPLEITRARLVSAIRSLPEAQGREALLAAYGLRPETKDLPTLANRRGAYGKRVKRGADTLADRENAAIRELALTLLTAYYAGAPLPAQLPVPHGGYLIEYLNVSTVYLQRRFSEHQQERRIVSLVDGAECFRYHSSDTDSNGRTRVIAVEGCTVETEYVPGGSLHRLCFPEPISRGDIAEFTFIEKLDDVESQVVPEEDFAGQSFETPALVYRQEATFLGGRPPVIWAYHMLSRVGRPGTPENGELLDFGHSNTISREFHQLHGGFFSGIAWRWG